MSTTPDSNFTDDAHANDPHPDSPSGQPSQGRPSPEVLRRRRLVVFGAAGTLVIAVAAVTAFAWPGFARPEPAPVPTITVTPTPPTPTHTPSPRSGEQTSLTDALPDSVLQYVQVGMTTLDKWQDDGAVEAWTVTYADGAESSASTIVVEVGQWRQGEAAQAFLTDQLDGTSGQTGDVSVGGTVVGAYTLIAPQGTDSPTAQGELWWRNDTVVFRASGPASALQAFFSAYPL
ncbi:MAG: hypothetical protein LBB54_02490 [Cellulomonadaceae bacterium]|jgi:hypothetical protein|nr:hypothetical protein [Cellulomonadaceae bacterium]